MSWSNVYKAVRRGSPIAAMSLKRGTAVLVRRASAIWKILGKYHQQAVPLNQRKVATEALNRSTGSESEDLKRLNVTEASNSSTGSESEDLKPLNVIVVVPDDILPKRREAVTNIAQIVAEKFAGAEKIGQIKLEYRLRDLRFELCRIAYDAIENPETLKKDQVLSEMSDILGLAFNAIDQKNTNWSSSSVASDWLFTNELAKSYDRIRKEQQTPVHT